jgi:hypothetical protein
MSATPGKVEIVGVERVADQDVFVLRFIQARNPEWVGRTFFARVDPAVTWLDQLRPAFGARRFFWEDAMDEIRRTQRQEAWERIPVRGHAVFHDPAGWE